MKFANTINYYYACVKNKLEDVSIPTDYLYEKVKDNILANLDLQLYSDNATIVKESISPMVKVLSNPDYAFNQKIIDPVKANKIQELALHLSILLNIYKSDLANKVTKTEIRYERLPNQIFKYGEVLEQYEPTPHLNHRIPNEFFELES